jgi:hypothetical protein
MDKPVTRRKQVQDKGENWHGLYPEDEYRQPERAIDTTIERKLYPRNRYRPADTRSGHDVEKRIYPLDKYRSLDERNQPQVDRVLWIKSDN